jgi:hypothetical protein
MPRPLQIVAPPVVGVAPGIGFGPRSEEAERLQLRIRRLQALARGLRIDARGRRPSAARAYHSHAAELEAQVLRLQERASRQDAGDGHGDGSLFD